MELPYHLQELAEATADEENAYTGLPRRVHISYSYSDVALPLNEDIVRRIRFDCDRLFVPVIKREVYRYATGGTKTFVHFGFGVEHEPGLPILDKAVYSAPKPRFGYLAQLGRADVVALWAQGKPFTETEPADGTPGETVPFNEKIYAFAKFQDDAMRSLAAQTDSTTRDLETGDEIRQLAYRAVMASRGVKVAAQTKKIDDASEHLRLVLKEEKKHNDSFLALTEDERAAMAWLNSGGGASNPTNAVHFLPTKPAVRGGIVVVPR